MSFGGHVGRALRVPVFRRVWFAALVSTMGIWMQITGRAFLVYDITGSTSALGTIYLASYLPQLVLGPYAGAIVDRYDRRRTVLIGTSLLVVTSTVTGLLAATGTATLLTLSLVSLATGTLQTVTQTASMALMPALVDRDDLSSAVSMNAVTGSGTRVVGPLLAGALIPLLGVAWLFWLNALSLLPVLLVWSRTSVPPLVEQGSEGTGVLEGLRFARRTPALAVSLPLLTVLSAIGMVYQPLGVAYTTAVLAHDDKTLGATYFGLFQGAIGVGALIGILAVGSLSERRPAALLLGTGAVFSVALVGLGLATTLPAALVIGVVLGGCQFANSNLTLALAQHHAPEELRGRVMSLAMVAFVGVLPLSSFVLGRVATAVGTQETFVLCGVVCMAAVLLALRWRATIRLPVYEPTEVGSLVSPG